MQQQPCTSVVGSVRATVIQLQPQPHLHSLLLTATVVRLLAGILVLDAAAGYAGHPSEELLDSLKVTRYQSSKAALSFAEYSSSCSNRLGVDDVQQLLQASSSKGGNGRLRLAFN